MWNMLRLGNVFNDLFRCKQEHLDAECTESPDCKQFKQIFPLATQKLIMLEGLLTLGVPLSTVLGTLSTSLKTRLIFRSTVGSSSSLPGFHYFSLLFQVMNDCKAWSSKIKNGLINNISFLAHHFCSDTHFYGNLRKMKLVPQIHRELIAPEKSQSQLRWETAGEKPWFPQRHSG